MLSSRPAGVCQRFLFAEWPSGPQRAFYRACCFATIEIWGVRDYVFPCWAAEKQSSHAWALHHASQSIFFGEFCRRCVSVFARPRNPELQVQQLKSQYPVKDAKDDGDKNHRDFIVIGVGGDRVSHIWVDCCTFSMPATDFS
jgi:hypothetical protein